MASIEERVRALVVEQLGVSQDQVNPQASFINDLGVDSLDTVELVMAFEEEFGIDIPDEDAEKMVVVADVIGYIKHYTGERSREAEFDKGDPRMAKKAKMNSYDDDEYDSTDASTERPNIAEKVRFWEEQDKINQALIPRVKELHEIVTDLHKRTANISSQIAEAEARVLQKVQEESEQRFKQVQSQIAEAEARVLQKAQEESEQRFKQVQSQIQEMQKQDEQVKPQADQNQDGGCVSVLALILSILALGLSIYQWFA